MIYNIRAAVIRAMIARYITSPRKMPMRSRVWRMTLLRASAVACPFCSCATRSAAWDGACASPLAQRARVQCAWGVRARGEIVCMVRVPAQLHVAVEEAQAAAGDAKLVRDGLHTSGGGIQLSQGRWRVKFMRQVKVVALNSKQGDCDRAPGLARGRSAACLALILVAPDPTVYKIFLGFRLTPASNNGIGNISGELMVQTKLVSKNLKHKL
jgi:hypothetical protein